MGSKSDLMKVFSGNKILSDHNSIENFQNKYSPYVTQKSYILMNSKEQKISNPFVSTPQGHPIQLQEKHTSSLLPGHIISPSQRAPQGYICVGRVVESPSKDQVISSPQNGLHILNDNSNVIMNEFPASFNPRKAANMPSKEKVNKWIRNVPFRYNSSQKLTVDCFPAVTTYSSSSSGSGSFDFGEQEAIVELQARRVTRYATRLYINEEEPVARLEDFDDNYYDSDGNLIDFNEEGIVNTDNSLSFDKVKKESDYIFQTTF